MSTSADIPVEIRARVEANALFDAVREGDYAAAAAIQGRLRAMGWYVGRVPSERGRERPARRESGRPSGQEASAR